MKEELLTINTKNWAKGIYIIVFSNTQRTVKKSNNKLNLVSESTGTRINKFLSRNGFCSRRRQIN